MKSTGRFVAGGAETTEFSLFGSAEISSATVRSTVAGAGGDDIEVGGRVILEIQHGTSGNGGRGNQCGFYRKGPVFESGSDFFDGFFAAASPFF
jgi:hypothetical protein